MILLDILKEEGNRKKRFFFVKWWVSTSGVEKVVRKAWEPAYIGSPMY